MDIKKLTSGMKKRNLMFHIRNKRSVFDFGLETLRSISKYKFYVYNGMSYMLSELDKYILGSVIGEFIFTKMRSSAIHTLIKKSKKRGAKKGKHKLNKKLRRKRYFMGLSSKRARLKEKSRIRVGV